MSTPSTPTEQFIAAMKEAITDTRGKDAEVIAASVSKTMGEYLATRFPVPSSGFTGLKSMGQQLLDNVSFREWIKDGSKTGRMGNFGPVPLDHPVYSVKDGDYIPPLLRGGLIETKDINSAQFPTAATVLPFTPFPRRRDRVRDLMPVQGIGTPKVDYAEISGFSNNAATQIGEGALKGQSEIVTTQRTATAVTIATFMAVARQALNNVPQIRAWLEATMEDFLSYEEDDQLLNGTGVNSLHGLLNAAIQTLNAGADTKLDAIRKAVTKVELAIGSGSDTVGYTATGLVLHPNDAEALDLAKDGNSRYMLLPDGGPPTEGGTKSGRRIWRLAPVTTPAIAQGTALIGAFDVGSTLLIYKGLEFRASDSHDDFFRRNKVALLAEYEGMHPIYSPKAYCKLVF